MRWNPRGLVAGAVIAAVMGCAEQVASPPSADLARAQIVERVHALHARVQAAGAMTEAHQQELARLKRDVEAWRAATGRTDMGFMGQPEDDADTSPGATTAAAPRGGGGTCGPCVPVVVLGDIICFLDAVPPCINGHRKCTYTCWYDLDAIQSR